MKLKDAAITILVNGEYTEIELHDKLSGVNIASVRLTPDQLSKALGRLSYTPCEISVSSDFSKINKKMLVDRLIFPFNDEGLYSNREKQAAEESLKYVPEGWEADGYFNSQNSFFTKDGKRYAACTIRKWE